MDLSGCDYSTPDGIKSSQNTFHALERMTRTQNTNAGYELRTTKYKLLTGSSSGGTLIIERYVSGMFDVTVCHPLSQARIHDGMDIALFLQMKAWDEKVRRFGRVRRESATSAKLFPMSLSSLGGWHPDSHRAVESTADNTASRTLTSVHSNPANPDRKRRLATQNHRFHMETETITMSII